MSNSICSPIQLDLVAGYSANDKGSSSSVFYLYTSSERRGFLYISAGACVNTWFLSVPLQYLMVFSCVHASGTESYTYWQMICYVVIFDFFLVKLVFSLSNWLSFTIKKLTWLLFGAVMCYLPIIFHVKDVWWRFLTCLNFQTIDFHR